MEDTDQKLKSGHHPLFIPNIPIFPVFHWLTNGKHHLLGVKSKPGFFYGSPWAVYDWKAVLNSAVGWQMPTGWL